MSSGVGLVGFLSFGFGLWWLLNWLMNIIILSCILGGSCLSLGRGTKAERFRFIVRYLRFYHIPLAFLFSRLSRLDTIFVALSSFWGIHSICVQCCMAFVFASILHLCCLPGSSCSLGHCHLWLLQCDGLKMCLEYRDSAEIDRSGSVGLCVENRRGRALYIQGCFVLVCYFREIIDHPHAFHSGISASTPQLRSI